MNWYCCSFHAESKLILENENFIEINFRSSQIMFATWFDAKSSKIALSETCIEFCWVNEIVSHRALFLLSINLDVMIIFSNMQTNIWRFCSNVSTDILMLSSEHVNWHRDIVIWIYRVFEACIEFRSMCKSWYWL